MVVDLAKCFQLILFLLPIKLLPRAKKKEKENTKNPPTEGLYIKGIFNKMQM